MWKCPNCETINEDEKCFICGTPKSAAIAKQKEEESLPLPPPPRQPDKNYSSEPSPGEGGGFKWGYIMLALAGVIFMIVCLSQCS